MNWLEGDPVIYQCHKLRGCKPQLEDELFPCQPEGLYAIRPYHGWSVIIEIKMT